MREVWLNDYYTLKNQNSGRLLFLLIFYPIFAVAWGIAYPVIAQVPIVDTNALVLSTTIITLGFLSESGNNGAKVTMLFRSLPMTKGKVIAYRLGGLAIFTFIALVFCAVATKVILSVKPYEVIPRIGPLTFLHVFYFAFALSSLAQGISWRFRQGVINGLIGGFIGGSGSLIINGVDLTQGWTGMAFGTLCLILGIFLLWRSLYRDGVSK